LKEDDAASISMMGHSMRYIAICFLVVVFIDSAGERKVLDQTAALQLFVRA
jgi:hypothetical protein